MTTNYRPHQPSLFRNPESLPQYEKIDWTVQGIHELDILGHTYLLFRFFVHPTSRLKKVFLNGLFVKEELFKLNHPPADLPVLEELVLCQSDIPQTERIFALGSMSSTNMAPCLQHSPLGLCIDLDVPTIAGYLHESDLFLARWRHQKPRSF